MQIEATLERPTGQADFYAAAAEFERHQAEFDRRWKLNSAACEAWGIECPRVGAYFDEHGLGIGMDRERVVRTLEMNTWVEGQPDEPAIEALATEFMEYQASSKASAARFKIDELEESASEYGEAEYFPSRERLMAIPASDHAVAPEDRNRGHLAERSAPRTRPPRRPPPVGSGMMADVLAFKLKPVIRIQRWSVGWMVTVRPCPDDVASCRNFDSEGEAAAYALDLRVQHDWRIRPQHYESGWPIDGQTDGAA